METTYLQLNLVSFQNINDDSFQVTGVKSASLYYIEDENKGHNIALIITEECFTLISTILHIVKNNEGSVFRFGEQL